MEEFCHAPGRIPAAAKRLPKLAPGVVIASMKPFQFWKLGLLLAIALSVDASVAATAEPGRDRPAAKAAGQSILVFIGTYTGPKSHGIYRFRFDRSTATPSAPELAAETESPSFLAIHPNQRFLYAVG